MPNEPDSEAFGHIVAPAKLASDNTYEIKMLPPELKTVHCGTSGYREDPEKHAIFDYFSGILSLPPSFRLTSQVARRMTPL
jgi:hypothetical protein